MLAVREGVRETNEPEEMAEPDPIPEIPPDRSEEVDEALRRMGFEPLLRRAVSTRPWNGRTGEVHRRAVRTLHSHLPPR